MWNAANSPAWIRSGSSSRRVASSGNSDSRVGSLPGRRVGLLLGRPGRQQFGGPRAAGVWPQALAPGQQR